VGRPKKLETMFDDWKKSEFGRLSDENFVLTNERKSLRTIILWQNITIAAILIIMVVSAVAAAIL
jgi:hypothetical protein